MSANDKGTGRASKVTISADKGRLSNEEIERLLKEAADAADADKAEADKVLGRNDLESYLYGLRSSLDAFKTGPTAMSEADKSSVRTAADKALQWLEANKPEDVESRDVYDEKKKDVEKVANPIITKAYNSSSAGASASEDKDKQGDGANNTNDGGEDKGKGREEPTVEEVD